MPGAISSLQITLSRWTSHCSKGITCCSTKTSHPQSSISIQSSLTTIALMRSNSKQVRLVRRKSTAEILTLWFNLWKFKREHQAQLKMNWARKMLRKFKSASKPSTSVQSVLCKVLPQIVTSGVQKLGVSPWQKAADSHKWEIVWKLTIGNLTWKTQFQRLYISRNSKKKTDNQFQKYHPHGHRWREPRSSANPRHHKSRQ